MSQEDMNYACEVPPRSRIANLREALSSHPFT
jgi:hypothetical protein